VKGTESTVKEIHYARLKGRSPGVTLEHSSILIPEAKLNLQVTECDVEHGSECHAEYVH
jgi:hypothetical protein